MNTPPKPTLVPTFTPHPTHIPAPTATAPPTATPAPSARLQAAEELQRIGDYDGAMARYKEILSQQDETVAGDALFHLGETQYRAGQPRAAAGTLQRFLAGYPQSRWAPHAHFLLGEIARDAGSWEEAIRHYRDYDSANDVIAPYVAERMAKSYEALGKTEDARREYRRIVEDSGVDRVWRTITAEKIANQYFEAGQYEQALEWYDRVLTGARIGYYRAEMMYQAGLALEGLGRDAEAWQRFAAVVVQYPATEHAAKSLEELQTAHYAVNPFQQGLIQFYNGQYKLAITLFRRYLKGSDLRYAPNAHYFIALSYDRQHDVDRAVGEMDTLLRDYPASGLASKVPLEKGRIYAAAGDTNRALAAYRSLAQEKPEDPLAPQGLWKAAEMLEQQGRSAGAATAFENLVAQYPADDGADDALDRAAMIRYRAGDTSGAQSVWLRLSAEYPQSDRRAKALYWAGKVAAAAGDVQAAHTRWQEAAQADPESFYGQRANDLLAHRHLTVLPRPIHNVESSSTEQQALEAWLQSWAAKPVTGTGSGAAIGVLPESVHREQIFRRGEELLALDLRSEAYDLFQQVLETHSDHARILYALARYFRLAGMHSLSISAAERVARLSPAQSLFDTPVALQRLVYPLPFTDSILAQAQDKQVDPLLLAGLIWQESRWEPSATSEASALGLAQVIPDTGRWIALQLHRPDFTPDDLYRPIVGLEFGAYYLARQLRSFDGDVLRALAAYNAGPGNVQRWNAPDTDLFVENIDLAETRLYLERIYAHYRAYETAYRKG